MPRGRGRARYRAANADHPKAGHRPADAALRISFRRERNRELTIAKGKKERRAKDSFDRDGLAIQHEPRASAVRQPVNGAALLRSGGIASTTALRIFCCGNLPTPVAVR